jgi:hypothetical protein
MGICLIWVRCCCCRLPRYHFLGCMVHFLDNAILDFLGKCPKQHEMQAELFHEDEKESEMSYTPSHSSWWISVLFVKTLRGLFTACRYALSLMLMLVAMTFNPGLFLALFVGYWFGDIVFCDVSINLKLKTYKHFYNATGRFMRGIHWALCIPTKEYHRYRELVCPSESENSPGLANMITYFLKIMPRIISLVFLVVLLVWIVEVQGSFACSGDGLFGWHALLLSLLVVMFSNEALLVYKAPQFIQFRNNHNLT